MKLLAIQLKRIGDLVLTVPALAEIRRVHPDAHLTLAVHTSGAPLLPAIPQIDAGIVFGPGRGWTPWQQVLTGNFDHVLDFTGTDRSATATALSRARRRITFDWVRKNRARALAYSRFVESSVRENHTIDHYLHLAEALVGPTSTVGTGGCASGIQTGRLKIPDRAQIEATRLLQTAAVSDPFVLLHPGTARPEKYWLTDRWIELIAHLRHVHGLDCVVTGGRDSSELAHLAEIGAAADMERGNTALDGTRLVDPGRVGRFEMLAGCVDLLTLAALIEKAALVISCDTVVVHLAAAFERPQIALFGPTNPFHWRPRHPRALVISAAQPDGPLSHFDSRMKGAPMERLSTDAVIRATDALLLRNAPSESHP